MTKLDKVAVLEASIRAHQAAYDEGKPTISDAAFDTLVEALRKMAPSSAVLYEFGAPRSTQKIRHQSPMLSLEKCYDEKKLRQWLTAVPGPWVVQPKYDGVALSIRIVRGKIVSAATRGDGTEGDDVTDAAKLIPEIQQLQIGREADGELRGEVVMHRATFDKHYAAEFANPRNLVAGLLGASARNVSAVALGRCRFYAYGTTGNLSALAHTPQQVYENGEREQVIDAVLNFDRNKHPMECDGVVIKTLNLGARSKLGETAHHPRWALAWKFQGESGQTRLTNVEWEVSRTRAITPVAVFEPVELSGVTITRATLHNFARFEELGCRIGASLVVTRRGGVIPHVESVIAAKSNSEVLKPPDRCPACNGMTRRVGVILECATAQCRGARKEALLYWCKTTGMLGWGRETIAAVFDSDLVRTPVDFYRLDQARLCALIGDRTAANLLAEVDKTRTLRPEVFFAALGIEGIGIENAKKILGTVVFERLTDPKLDLAAALQLVPGIGTKRAQTLAWYIRDQEDLIDSLLAHVALEGNAEEVEEAARATGPFAGKQVVFTGALAAMERPAAMELVRQAGGVCSNSLTKATDILVVGDKAKPDALTKRDKAIKYGTEVIDETEFQRRLAAQ